MKKILVFITAVSCIACNRGNKSGPDAYYETYTESFVMMYRNLVSLDTYVMDDNSLWIYENTEAKEITGKKFPEEFAVLSEKYGDTGYDRVVRVHYGMGPNQYLSQSFTGVEITSDTDFNNIPAGNSLSGITAFYSLTPYPYVNSGYEDVFDWSKYTGLETFRMIFRELLYHYLANQIAFGTENLHPVSKTVSDLTRDDLTLLGRGFYVFDNQRPQVDPMAVIKFTESPQVNKEHKITVKFTDTEGQIYASNTVDVEFE